MKLSGLSVKRPVTITMFFIGLAFLGIVAFNQLGIDLLPNVYLPHLIVQTSYQNSTPEEVEKLITEPLESSIGTVRGDPSASPILLLAFASESTFWRSMSISVIGGILLSAILALLMIPLLYMMIMKPEKKRWGSRKCGY